MKLLITMLAMFFSTSGFSNIYYVKKVICDGKERPVLNGERIFFNNTLFGYGKDELIESSKCRIIDFFPIIRNEFGSADDYEYSNFLPVSIKDFGQRRNSCVGDGKTKLTFKGTAFDSAKFVKEGEKLHMYFDNFLECNNLEFRLKF